MEMPHTVVLFGDSLLMDTVEASLAESHEIGLMRVHTTGAEVERCFKLLQPDLIVFDWDAPHYQLVLSLLREQPGIPLIGLDINQSKAIVLNSEQHIVLSIHELARVIHQQTTAHPTQKISPGVLTGERSFMERTAPNLQPGFVSGEFVSPDE